MIQTPAAREPAHRVLRGQTWVDYQAALDERDREGRKYRITYDRGMLELMPKSSTHEILKKQIAGLVEEYCVSANVPFSPLGEWTCAREEINRGLEPDECYYVQNEPEVRGRHVLDLDVDPPPDLAIEIEVSRTVIDRLGIYAALGVPEVWRYDGTTLTVMVLGADGEYGPAAASAAFPTLPIPEVQKRLTTAATVDRATWLREWREWVNETSRGRQPSKSSG